MKSFGAFTDTAMAVGVAVEKSRDSPPPKAGMPGVDDSVSAADVAVRKEAPAVWLASAKAVSIKGVAGVTEEVIVVEGVVEGEEVLEGVNARMVAVAALGVLVWVAATVAVGSVPVMVTVTDGEGVMDNVAVGGKVADGGTFVNVG